MKRPTPYQQERLDGLLQKLAEGTRTLSLKGYAGTGKTFLLAHLLQRYDGTVALAAPTHRAKREMANSLAAYGIEREEPKTLHALLGLRPHEDLVHGILRFRRLGHARNPLEDYDLVILDEASMVSQEVIDNFLQLLAEDQSLLCIGDPAQLPPVKAKSHSLFDTADAVFELREVLRHQGPILELATRTRALDRGRPPISPDPPALLTMPSEETWLEAFLAEVEVTGNDGRCVALAYTNQTVDELCRLTRTRLYGEDASAFVAGERLLAVDPIQAPRESPSKPGDILANTNDELVVLGAKRKLLDLPGDGDLGCPPAFVWMLEVAGPDGEFTFETLSSSERGELDASIQRLTQLAKDDQWQFKYWNGIRAWRQQCLPRVRSAAATTIHKSQGGTYDSVFVHLPDLDRCRNLQTLNRLAYVSFSRASRRLICLGA